MKSFASGWVRVLGCWTLALVFGLAPMLGFAQKAKPRAEVKRAPNPAFASVQDDPKLPRVLLIGDSISIGYTLDVRELLERNANVHRIPANGGPTITGLKDLKSWLGDGQWDVIHFNWGLHDLKYMGANGQNLADPNAPGSHRQVPLPDYEKNLHALVRQLKSTGARLVWCATTPVPEGAAGRVPGDERTYNEAAARVMRAEGIAINDLHAYALKGPRDAQLPANVHYTADGSRYLAERVAKSIEAALHEQRIK